MRYFPKGTLVSRPQAGFVLWLELPASVDTLVLFHQALEEKSSACPAFSVPGQTISKLSAYGCLF